jgi:AraC-like DNA-binding protein
MTPSRRSARRTAPAPGPGSAPHPSDPPRVLTILTPDERHVVDSAGLGCYVTHHHDSLDGVLDTLREGPADAVLVSVSRCVQRDVPAVARLVREFPRVPHVALLTGDAPRLPEAVLSLGRSGVRRIVDVRRPHGWQELRVLLAAERDRDIERRAIARCREALAGAPEELLLLLDALFAAPPTVHTVAQFAPRLGVASGTLMSRFFRAGLPAPKRYLAMARLVRAAARFENPGATIAAVADQLEYSSPQAFGRHVRQMLGVTPTAFRQHWTGERMLTQFLDELIIPHRETLRTFRPVRSGGEPARPSPRASRLQV